MDPVSDHPLLMTLLALITLQLLKNPPVVFASVSTELWVCRSLVTKPRHRQVLCHSPTDCTGSQTPKKQQGQSPDTQQVSLDVRKSLVVLSLSAFPSYSVFCDVGGPVPGQCRSH